MAGKKAAQISKEELNKVPTTKVLMVKLKDRNFGKLPLTIDQLRIIKENQTKLHFVNGKTLNEG